MWTIRDWLFKILLPVCLFGIIAYGMVTQKGMMNAEIPVDNQPDPLPLDKKMCPPSLTCKQCQQYVNNKKNLLFTRKVLDYQSIIRFVNNVNNKFA